MKVRYERGAVNDLEEIFAYVATDNRVAAARLVARIENAVKRIAENPRIGETTRKTHFRRLAVEKYLIVYEIGPDEVVVQYVRHSARRRPWERE